MPEAWSGEECEVIVAEYFPQAFKKSSGDTPACFRMARKVPELLDDLAVCEAGKSAHTLASVSDDQRIVEAVASRREVWRAASFGPRLQQLLADITSDFQRFLDGAPLGDEAWQVLAGSQVDSLGQTLDVQIDHQLHDGRYSTCSGRYRKRHFRLFAHAFAPWHPALTNPGIAAFICSCGIQVATKRPADEFLVACHAALPGVFSPVDGQVAGHRSYRSPPGRNIPAKGPQLRHGAVNSWKVAGERPRIHVYS